MLRTQCLRVMNSVNEANSLIFCFHQDKGLVRGDRVHVSQTGLMYGKTSGVFYALAGLNFLEGEMYAC